MHETATNTIWTTHMLCWSSLQQGSWSLSTHQELWASPLEEGEERHLPDSAVRMKWNDAWKTVPRNLSGTYPCFINAQTFYHYCKHTPCQGRKKKKKKESPCLQHLLPTPSLPAFCTELALLFWEDHTCLPRIPEREKTMKGRRGLSTWAPNCSVLPSVQVVPSTYHALQHQEPGSQVSSTHLVTK